MNSQKIIFKAASICLINIQEQKFDAASKYYLKILLVKKHVGYLHSQVDIQSYQQLWPPAFEQSFFNRLHNHFFHPIFQILALIQVGLQYLVMGGCVGSSKKQKILEKAEEVMKKDIVDKNNTKVGSRLMDVNRQQKIIFDQQLFKIQGEKLKTLLHYSIGALTSLDPNKRLVVGSGVLISKNLVLTCAHNVYDISNGVQYKSIKFYLPDGCKAKAYYKIEAIRYPQQFRTSSDRSKINLDFALLKLEKQVQYNQFLQLSVPCPNCLLSNSQIYLNIFGYPIFQRNFEYLDQYGHQFVLSQYGLGRNDRIIILDPSQHKMGYGISTFPGQSGCPVVVGNQIIGIHNGGGKANENFNVARTVDMELVSFVKQWCKQMKGFSVQIKDKRACSHIQPTIVKEQQITSKEKEKENELQEISININSNQLEQYYEASQHNRNPPINMSQVTKNNKSWNHKQRLEDNEQETDEQKIILSEELFRIEGEQLDTLLHRSIGALTWLNKNRLLAVGSGVLISKNMVLTAAHNIFDRRQDQEYTDFKFYIGANGTAKKYYEVENYRFLKQYRQCDSKDAIYYDFALLKLKNQVQYQQFLEFLVPCNKCLYENNKEACLQIFGFPGQYENNYRSLDKFGVQFKLYQYGLARKNRIACINQEKQKIGYGISTLPGQSGCPIVLQDKIIGIHNGGAFQRSLFIFNLTKYSVFFAIILYRQEQKYFYINKYICENTINPFRMYSKELCHHIKPEFKDYLKQEKEEEEEEEEEEQQDEEEGEDQDKEEEEKDQEKERKKNTILNLENKGIKEINLRDEIDLNEIYLTLNQISIIDISKNINLTHLNLSQNALNMIDLSNNIKLTNLSLQKNKLTQIDVTKNINLTHLNFNLNKISDINLSSNQKITLLNICSNKLSKIDISNNVNMMKLYLQDNKLSNIDISKNIKLISLSLSSNKFYQIDVHKNTDLVELNLDSNLISAIDLSQNINLTSLSLKSNKISKINVSENINLTLLDLSSNKLSSIDLSKNISLRSLSISFNQLSDIDVKNNINLTHLSIASDRPFPKYEDRFPFKNENKNHYSKKLSEIDISKNINLTSLCLSGNSLSKLDVRNNTKLTFLNIEFNHLQTIDIRKNINLTKLYANNNNLSKINVTKNKNLTNLNLSFNQISEINVQHNINLKKLYLSNNRISEINVQHHINLKKLYLSNNQISAINVENHTSLTQLSVQKNKLIEIDASSSINLAYLYLSDNNLEFISFHFSSALLLTGFSDQRSKVCEVQMLCKSNYFQRCENQANRWNQMYSKEGRNNDHGCHYNFTAQKIS